MLAITLYYNGIIFFPLPVQEGEGEPDSSYFYTSKIVLTQRGVPGAKLGADAAGTQGNGPQLWHAAAPRKFLTDSRREQSVNVLRRYSQEYSTIPSTFSLRKKRVSSGVSFFFFLSEQFLD